MHRIKIYVAGDRWINRDQVIQDIQASVGSTQLIFEINTEGPSLWATGIADTILQNINSIGIPPHRVWIDRWHNTVEKIPFKRAYHPKLSHFFWMSETYRHAPRQAVDTVLPLGFFVGRITLDRAKMLWDISQQWNHQALLSLMRQSGPTHITQEHLTMPWIKAEHAESFWEWIKNPSISSLTGHSVNDQYLPGNDTNRDIVAYYDAFHVEVVAETFCQGDAFFPTEKTVRPLSQGKPMVIYGPKNFLERLRRLGFQTWNDIWDESYDKLEGADRWQAMQDELGRIVNNRLWNHRLIQPKSDLNKAVLDYLIAKHKPQ